MEGGGADEAIREHRGNSSCCSSALKNKKESIIQSIIITDWSTKHREQRSVRGAGGGVRGRGTPFDSFIHLTPI